jgi:hypothetical protein
VNHHTIKSLRTTLQYGVLPVLYVKIIIYSKYIPSVYIQFIRDRIEEVRSDMKEKKAGTLYRPVLMNKEK